MDHRGRSLDKAYLLRSAQRYLPRLAVVDPVASDKSVSMVNAAITRGRKIGNTAIPAVIMPLS